MTRTDKLIMLLYCVAAVYAISEYNLLALAFIVTAATNYGMVIFADNIISDLVKEDKTDKL